MAFLFLFGPWQHRKLTTAFFILIEKE